MSRIGLVLACIGALTSLTILAEAQQSPGGLIQVKPSYQEATYVPQQNAQQAALATPGPPPPSPRDQLYIFWLIGRMLSYPVDKVEAFITNKVQDFRKPSLRPASAPAADVNAVNPFDAVDTSEIPPAPPALGGAASR